MTEQPATNKIRIVEKKRPKKAINNEEKKVSSKSSAKIEAKKEEVSGKVSKVESRGLTINLENGEVAFLPKENMHIGKKKKLEEIFSEGFVIRAKIKNKKEGKIILTQKEETPQQSEESAEKVSKGEKKTSKKEKKHNKEKKSQKEQMTKKAKIKQPIKEEQEEQPKQKTLKDLKKLQSIGNMKISVGRGKKSNLTKLAEEKKEELIELPKVPEGLLENIVTSTKEATERFSNLTEELSERNLLQGNSHNE